MADMRSIDIPAEITKLIPYAQAREKLAVPIGSYRETLYLAVAEPFTFSHQSFFAVMTGMKICLVLADLGLHTSLLTEHELTRVLQMLRAIQNKIGINNDEDSNLADADLEMETKPEDVLAEIERLQRREEEKLRVK